MLKSGRKDVLLLMIIDFIVKYWSEALNVIGFIITLLTFAAALNVRSQIVHSHEKQSFHTNHEHIIGKLEGFIVSLTENSLGTPNFFHQIDIYLADLSSKYTFLGIFIKIQCKYISYKLQNPVNNENFRTGLAKNLTKLKNLISKEVNL